MRSDSRQPTLSGRLAGFSLVELLVVVIIILITSAIALPGMLRYMRNYRVRGAAQQVASMVQTARTRAITRNVNNGLIFGVIDQDTYGFLIEDPPVGPESSGLAHLPDGVHFEIVGATTTGVRFDRLGRAIQEPPPIPAVPCPSPSVCDDNPGAYVQAPATGGALIRVKDFTTNVEFQVEVTAGGRVKVKAPIETSPVTPP